MCGGMNLGRIERIREEQQIKLLEKKIHPDAIEMVKSHSMDDCSNSSCIDDENGGERKHGN